jgi:uncharacterized membrane protein YfcA
VLEPILVAAILLLAGMVKGVVGLGLPTVSIGFLGMMMPLSNAVALLLLPSLATNATQAFGRPAWPVLRRIWPMLAGVVGGTFAGSGFLGAEWAPRMLGGVLVAYAVMGLAGFNPRLSPRAERWTAVPVGLSSGLIAAATGVFVLPVAPWLQAIRMPRDDLIQALGLFFTIGLVSLGALLAVSGTLWEVPLTNTAVALVGAFTGLWVGTRLRHRLSPASFVRVLFSALGGLGLWLLLA